MNLLFLGNISLEHWFNNQTELFISPFGILVFITLYVIWVTLLLPGSWLSMVAGLIYGTFLGSIFVFLGALLGAILTFFCGRTFLRSWARKKLLLFPKLQSIEDLVFQEGLKFIFLTRLSPLFPFGFLNLAYGLSKISIRDFMIGILGILPGTILYCSLGSLAGEITKFDFTLANRSDWISFTFSLVGILATLGVAFFILRATKDSLSEIDKSF
ncbi:TVP38/TMEM64 family protein [Prochlorococcus marinus]|uniref:TVP38/TMEM64 family membrane protein n=1 Tax=Prochlorococcus marinus (strain MIT 9211) TaxID=93059 RepID=A9BDC7_PROM4|nr:TVP38/TMEM64 family protein [Prochlorococcus marinus]ABX09740.1 Conserved hypothetical protein [Prochlorococcus marinus str. MIT 9211]